MKAEGIILYIFETITKVLQHFRSRIELWYENQPDFSSVVQCNLGQVCVLLSIYRWINFLTCKLSGLSIKILKLPSTDKIKDFHTDGWFVEQLASRTWEKWT